MTCADYLNANAGYPDAPSEASAEGTFAHAISENCLQLGIDAYDCIGITGAFDGFEFEWTDDDAENLQPGIDWVREQVGMFYGEHRVELSRWLGANQFGTLDRGIVGDDLIVISDLKWGRGIPVNPIRNKQQMLYALGFWWNIARHVSKATKFLIHIDQPRHNGGGGFWMTTLDELLAFGEEARDAAIRALIGGMRTASVDGCLWCKDKDNCSTYDAYILDMLSLGFEDLDAPALEMPDPNVLTPERRTVVLRHKGMISDWLDSLHGSCLADALAGRPTGGLKAVAGRKSPDTWLDKAAADRLLKARIGEKRFTKKLITPTQTSKLLTPEDLEAVWSHVKIGERKPSLVPLEDERPAIKAMEDEFEDLPPQNR